MLNMKTKKLLAACVMSFVLLMNFAACSSDQNGDNPSANDTMNDTVDGKTESLKEDIKQDTGNMKDDIDNTIEDVTGNNSDGADKK